MPINSIPEPAQPTPVTAGTTSLDELAEARGLPATLLSEVGIYAGDTGYKIPYPNLTGIWYEREMPYSGYPKYLSPKGAEPHLYNPKQIGPDVGSVWIAEGEFDTLTLINLGVNAVGLPGTGTMTPDEDGETKGRFRKAWVHLFWSCRPIIIAMDPDEAGQKATRGLKVAWPHAVVFENEHYDDLNDWWLKDPEGLRAAVDTHRPQTEQHPEPEKPALQTGGDVMPPLVAVGDDLLRPPY